MQLPDQARYTGHSELDDRIAGAHRTIEEVFAAVRSPGLSYAVVQDGELLTSAHLGYRDVERKTKADDDTIYSLASMTKAIIAILIGQLVHESLLDWQTPIEKIIPEFRCQTPEDGSLITIIDLLTHRTGLTNIDNLVLGSYNELILPKSDLLKSFASLRPTAPFRDSFVYNNNCYAVAGVVIEKITGMSLSRALHERLFAPLGMTRTGLRWPGHDVDDDVARAYKTLADGTQWEIPPPGSSEGTIWEAAGGVKSTISDLTRFYAAVLDSMAPLESRNRYRGAGGRPNVSTVKEGRTLYGGHNRRPASNLNEAGYALGWYRTQLPGNINTGNNKFYFPDGPIVGRGVDPTLCFHHNGLMPGSTSSVYLLPSHNTAIIVLHNGNAYGDAAVWSGQILVEAILNCPAVNDWAALAERGALGMLRHQPALQQELDSHQTLHDPGSEVAQYAGTYWNHAHLYKIAVEVGKGSNGSKNELRMKFQGLENERFGLRPYQMDAFRWDFDYDTACKLAREIPDFQAENYVMRFLRGGEGRVNALTWRWDDHFEKPEVFERE